MKNLRITFLLLIFGFPSLASEANFSVIQDFPQSETFNDSLGTVSIDGMLFIKHQVRAKETLYSLLKKYNSTNAEVQKANVALAGGNTIYINQVLRFPAHRPTRIISARSAAEVHSPGTTLHEVAGKETLYSIGKKYGISVNNIKRINDLVNNSISIGQMLLVRQDSSLAMDNSSSPAAKEVRESHPDDLKPSIFVVPNAPMGKKVTELGIAEVIATNKQNHKMLALHKTAPLGSLITVTNEATKKRIVVKVIGKLPNTGNNENILIRLSPAAFYKLDPKDIRIRAAVAYFLSPDFASNK